MFTDMYPPEKEYHVSIALRKNANFNNVDPYFCDFDADGNFIDTRTIPTLFCVLASSPKRAIESAFDYFCEVTATSMPRSMFKITAKRFRFVPVEVSYYEDDLGF